MKAPRWFFALWLTVIAMIVGGILLVRTENRRLREQIANEAGIGERVARLTRENERKRNLLGRLQADEGNSAQTLHDELVRARTELADAERRAGRNAMEGRAAAADPTAISEGNRDPRKAVTRLEFFKDAGQATPDAALETFVWAAMKGADDRQAGIIGFEGDAREQLVALVAKLSESDRAKYSTPEKLAALFFADALTKTPAAQISNVTTDDPRGAVVQLKGPGFDGAEIPMQSAPNGWRLAVSPKIVEVIERWTHGRPSEFAH